MDAILKGQKSKTEAVTTYKDCALCSTSTPVTRMQKENSTWKAKNTSKEGSNRTLRMRVINDVPFNDRARSADSVCKNSIYADLYQMKNQSLMSSQETDT
jgi:hypothetical protein